MKEIAARGRTQTGVVSATPSTDGSFVCRGGALRAGDQRVDFLISRADRGAVKEAHGNSVVGPVRTATPALLPPRQPGVPTPSAQLSQGDRRFA